MILGVIGGIIAGGLGIKWLSDANEMKGLIDLAREAGADTGEIDRLVIAAYLLIAAMVIGIVGGILTFKGNGKIAGALMIIGAIAPVILAPKALVFTCILLAGGIVSLMAKPEHSKANAAGL